jgi:hypothetical protein
MSFVYHKRSNIESAVSALKEIGDSVRSKTDIAIVNEVLCKILCHNICCLIQEQGELGIEPVFWKMRISWKQFMMLDKNLEITLALPSPRVYHMAFFGRKLTQGGSNHGA